MGHRYEIQSLTDRGWEKPRPRDGHDWDCPDYGAALLLRNAHAHSYPHYKWRVIDTETGEQVDHPASAV